MNGKCDAEIGSVKRGWHTCRKSAVVVSERRILGVTGSYYELEFCRQHQIRAAKTDLPNTIQILKVRQIERMV